jgi:hypothetical protein
MAIVSFRAATAITAGQPVTVGSGGTIYPSSATNLTNAKCVGLAIDTGDSGGLIRVNKDYLFNSLSGLTAGVNCYLALASGVINPSYSALDAEVSASVFVDSFYIVTLGRAVSASGLNVEIATPISTSLPTLTLEGSGAVGALLAETGATIDLE